MQLQIKTLTGKTIMLDVQQSDTVLSVKQQIQDKEGVQVEQQRLIFCGKDLQNDFELQNYSIGNGNLNGGSGVPQLHLVIRLR